MIGTSLIEELVQTVALSHLIKGHARVSLLLIAAPESGKTTVTRAAHCNHVLPVAMISGQSVVREVDEHPHTEFLLFNDLTAIRAMSPHTVNHLIVLLNQYTQDEHGVIALAGKEAKQIKRPIGIIGCIPYKTFSDHRARWRELGFVSRMLPFAYSYGQELIAEIKNSIDLDQHKAKSSTKKMPRLRARQVKITAKESHIRNIRALADARAVVLKQPGIRLLQHYHTLARAHALQQKRNAVNADDIKFLRAVDAYVSTDHCRSLNGDNNGGFYETSEPRRTRKARHAE